MIDQCQPSSLHALERVRQEPCTKSTLRVSSSVLLFSQTLAGGTCHADLPYFALFIANTRHFLQGNLASIDRLQILLRPSHNIGLRMTAPGVSTQSNSHLWVLFVLVEIECSPAFWTKPALREIRRWVL